MLQPLDGIKVLDLSRLLPGPYCSMILGDLGAEIIKIEEPKTGDPTRWSSPRIGSQSATFLNVNRNKKSLTLNLKDERGVEIFLKLAMSADIILEGFRPGVVDRLGIGYSAVKEINRRIIYCSLTGYGQEGPHRERSGHDINYLGLSGILGLTTDRDGNPVIPGIQIADLGGGLVATLAILAAILARERSGAGQYIDISMFDVMLSLLPIPAASLFAGQDVPVGRKLHLSGALACYNVYRTKDGKQLSVGALEPKFWQRFCQTINRPDLIDKQHCSESEQREVIAQLREMFLTRTQQEWMEMFSRTDACVEPVQNLDEAFSHPQTQHRAMIVETESTTGRIKQIGSPLKFSATPASIRSAPPALGENTDEILCSLGLSEAEIQELKRDGVC